MKIVPRKPTPKKTPPSPLQRAKPKGAREAGGTQRSQQLSEATNGQWHVDDSKPRHDYEHHHHIPVPAAGMRQYYEWRRALMAGHHPKSAADLTGDTHFEHLRGAQKDQCSIRLSQEHRVFFQIDERHRIVTVRKIGGHEPR